MKFVDTRDMRRFAAEKMQKVNLLETEQMFCDLYCLEPGQSQAPHTHAGATKFYYVLEGTGRFTVGSQERELGPGELAWAGPDEAHGVENVSGGRLVLLVSMAPHPGM
jgi:quercetin dioxygenase-like cupin family protein